MDTEASELHEPNDGAGCLLCDAPTTDGGVIYHPSDPQVAGVPIKLRHASYSLRRCSRCKFAFKWPRIDEQDLLDCYEAAPGDQWGEDVDTERRAYGLLASLIEKHRSGDRILDVGCFTGTLLAYLKGDWDRYGVEPALAAAETARGRGIRVLGPTIEGLDAEAGRFHTILSVDVLEHLDDPATHLKEMADRLEPGGCFVAVTGDTSTWPWRMQGSRHWYSAMPEHVSYYCPQALRKAGEGLGLEMVDRLVFRHTRSSFIDESIHLIKAFAYSCGVAVHRLIPNPITKVAYRRAAPVWMSAPNHMAVVLRKRV